MYTLLIGRYWCKVPFYWSVIQKVSIDGYGWHNGQSKQLLKKIFLCHFAVARIFFCRNYPNLIIIISMRCATKGRKFSANNPPKWILFNESSSCQLLWTQLPFVFFTRLPTHDAFVQVIRALAFDVDKLGNNYNYCMENFGKLIFKHVRREWCLTRWF